MSNNIIINDLRRRSSLIADFDDARLMSLAADRLEQHDATIKPEGVRPPDKDERIEELKARVKELGSAGVWSLLGLRDAEISALKARVREYEEVISLFDALLAAGNMRVRELGAENRLLKVGGGARSSDE